MVAQQDEKTEGTTLPPAAEPPAAQPAAAQPAAKAAATTGPSQVLILRHAEKPAEAHNPDLSPMGFARADMLAKAIPDFFPNIDFLFAAAPSKQSDRPVETLTPLSKTLAMPLDTDIADEGYEVLAADLLSDARYAGKRVVICWHHGNIPELALGLKVPKAEIKNAQGMEGMHWDPTVFDAFWLIKLADGAASLKISKQPPLKP
jgi:hypothetical protein